LKFSGSNEPVQFKEHVMLKSVSAGCLCLGLATLGVAVSRGQDAKNPESREARVTGDTATFTVEGDVQVKTTKQAADAAGVVVSGKGELVEIEVGQDDGVSDSKLNVYRFPADGQNVVLFSDFGKAVEKVHVGAAPGAARMAFQTAARGPHAIDRETKAALEKLITGLKEEANRLEGEGKRDEAEQKMQSTRAIERLLTAYQLGMGRSRVVHVTGPGSITFTEASAAAEELNKLQIRRVELERDLALKADVNDEAAAKIKQELANLKNVVRETHRLIEARAVRGEESGMAPVPPGQPMTKPGAPGTPAMPGMGGGIMTGTWPGGIVHFGGRANSENLKRQAEVLSRAAAQLKEAGLDERAKSLVEQSDNLKIQAQKMAKMEAELSRIYSSGPGSSGTGAISVVTSEGSNELQRSIKELHEQVQLLRKEVAEVRELLHQNR
jgi:hypothetical protein